MSILSRNDLKSQFISGTSITEEKFDSVFDSLFNVSDDSVLTGPIGYTGLNGLWFIDLSSSPTGPTSYGLTGQVAATQQGFWICIGASTWIQVTSSAGGTFVGSLVPATDITYDLGATGHRWRDLYISGTTIYIGDSKIQADPVSGDISFVNKTGQETYVGPSGLIGPTGNPGNQGPTGTPGNQGPTGNPGNQGPTGNPGNQGPTGIPAENITYSQLRSRIASSGLTAGTFYKITDYRTCYDRPIVGVTGNTTYEYVNSGVIEPLLVQAVGPSTLSSFAQSSSFPLDSIKYDAGFTATLLGGTAFGRIIERIDEFNNRTGYDHRTITFKRYKHVFFGPSAQAGTVSVSGSNLILSGSTAFESLSIGDVIGVVYGDIYESFPFEFSVTSTGSTTIGITGSTIPGGISGSNWFLPTVGASSSWFYNSYRPNNINGPSDYDLVNTFSIQSAPVNCQNNFIADNGTSILPNNVLFGVEINGNFIDSSSQQNTIGSNTQASTVSFNNFNSSQYNIIASTATRNQINGTFAGNNCTGGFSNNTTTASFYENRINGTFNGNSISSQFFGNLIQGQFIDSQIRATFSNSAILPSGYSSSNQINGEINSILIKGTFFTDNTITEKGSIAYCTINCDFRDNFIDGDFASNIEGLLFSNNQILNSFTNNTITGSTSSIYNNIFNNTTNNTISDSEISLNTFNGSFDTNTVSARLFGRNTIDQDFRFNLVDVFEFKNNKIQDGFLYNEITGSGLGFVYNEIQENFYNNQITGGATGNYIGIGASGNTISSTFSENTIGNYMVSNSISAEFEKNTIEENFQTNVILGIFLENSIKGSFSNNVLNDSFENNEIADGFTENAFGVFYRNSIGPNCQYNSMSNSVYDNVISDNFQYNSSDSPFFQNGIGSNFNYNVITAEISNNQIGPNFGSNTIGYSVKENQIGPGCTSNYIGGLFEGNSIQSNFFSNYINSEFSSNSIIGSAYQNSFFYDVKNNSINVNDLTGLTANGAIVQNSIITTNFVNNAIGSTFSNNQINSEFFESNLLLQRFDNNVISSSNFTGNYLNSETYSNSISSIYFVGNTHGGTAFKSNIISVSSYHDNDIQSEFYSNIISGSTFSSNETAAGGYEFATNEINCYQCYSNTFNASVEFNKIISYQFHSNTLGDFTNNIVQSDFYSNSSTVFGNNHIAGGSFDTNTISFFTNNQIKGSGDVTGNSISDFEGNVLQNSSMEDNTFTGPFRYCNVSGDLNTNNISADFLNNEIRGTLNGNTIGGTYAGITVQNNKFVGYFDTNQILCTEFLKNELTCDNANANVWAHGPAKFNSNKLTAFDLSGNFFGSTSCILNEITCESFTNNTILSSTNLSFQGNQIDVLSFDSNTIGSSYANQNVINGRNFANNTFGSNLFNNNSINCDVFDGNNLQSTGLDIYGNIFNCALFSSNEIYDNMFSNIFSNALIQNSTFGGSLYNNQFFCEMDNSNWAELRFNTFVGAIPGEDYSDPGNSQYLTSTVGTTLQVDASTGSLIATYMYGTGLTAAYLVI